MCSKVKIIQNLFMFTNRVRCKKLNMKINRVLTKFDNRLDGVALEIDGHIDLEPKKKPSVIIKLITGAIIGFINGFWGGGGGMVCVPLLSGVIGLPEKKSHATTLLVMLPLSIASLSVYIWGGNMQWVDGLKISIGFVAGGYLGALLLKKISNVWLSLIFGLVIIAGGLKLII